MHDDEPTFIPTTAWAHLISRMSHDADLRERLSVKLCPFTGAVEEYMVADQLCGMLNIWPEKWRAQIDAG